MKAIGNELGTFGASSGPMSGLKEAISQGASGKKMQSAADNAAGIALAIGLTSELGGLRQANRNVGDAMAVLQTAEGGASGVGDALGRMRELSIQAGNSTLSSSQRDIIQTEINQLSETIDHLSGTTEFNGTSLLDGSSPSLTFQVGTGSSSSDQMVVGLTDLGSSSLGVNALAMVDAASSMAGVDAVDGALDQLNVFQSSLGSSMNQLGEVQDNLQTNIVNTASSLSSARDADLGDVSSALVGNSIQLQFQIAMQVQGNATQVAALKLIG